MVAGPEPYASGVPARGSVVPGRRLPIPVLAVVVGLLAAACGGATKFPDQPTAGPRATPATTTTLAPPVASGGPSSLPAPTGTTARASTTTRPAAAATTRAPTARPTAPAVNAGDQAITRAALGPPGGAAGIILQATPATSLVVEVLEEPGVVANRPALDRVLSDLRRYSAKPVSEVHTALPAGSSSRRWTERELAAVADRSSKVTHGGGRFVLRMVFVRGQNVRSPDILAVSFRGDTFAAFPDRYGSAGQQVITTVTVHEVGHLLGLVDLYLDRDRDDTSIDPAGGGHSTNRGSVMYFAVDPSFLGAVFGAASDRFDPEDERDLAAIRAGAPRGSNPR